MIVATFLVPNFMFDILKFSSKINWVRNGDNEISYNDILFIQKNALGLRVEMSLDFVGVWVEDLKVSELYGVLTLFLQSENFSLELRTDKYEKEENR